MKHIGELLEKSEDCDGDDVVGMVAAYYCRRGSLLRKVDTTLVVLLGCCGCL